MIGVTTLLNHLIEAFSEIDDPRCDYKMEHNLLEILIMAICGVIAGAPELGRHCPVCQE
jgi:DDE_Tnp_1-associated